MGELILALVPVALGVVLSPLAIMALVAVLLSRDARMNGITYLIGWFLGLGGLMTLCLWLFPLLAVHELGEPPLWVPIVRVLLGLFLIGSAVWVYRKGRAHIAQMAAASSPREVVAASPQLPGWLHSVESFRPGRTLLLGLGLFVLNPVDASCAILAALDISLSDVDRSTGLWVAVVFVIIGTLPIALPVLYVVVRGADAQPLLDRVRTWIAGNTHVLNAALLLVIGALQLEKGISALL
ncbi:MULTISPECIES: GAP family protein [unclassified Microbacterium]|uniref:GAP family protein n=1 Tax=unclassified Microbacterium TaxID=2609290 RepID=UPI0004934927|nr:MULTISPECIES: GAP family protein [unclassified Microbacterium]MCV0333260.1 GAP family protein [Microbacterium sp.]MCV0375705.1 GAP family protein [Microbacterium sp.]MCV0388940.1 GAP family protein [Microbacterium sp.]MCV0417468.1 GAP family protein [Microbacterium sp.]MCV0420779.1 GAP family protein [Microbacterium sp.]